jgi:hypothetical protein
VKQKVVRGTPTWIKWNLNKNLRYLKPSWIIKLKLKTLISKKYSGKWKDLIEILEEIKKLTFPQKWRLNYMAPLEQINRYIVYSDLRKNRNNQEAEIETKWDF